MTLTGIMCTLEEERMVGLAVTAAADAIDELIVVDGGSKDQTIPTIMDAAEDQGLPIKIAVRPDLRLREARLKAFKMAEGTWCIIVDGDEIYHTDGPGDIKGLMKYTEGPEVVYSAPLNYLYLDFLHTRADQPQRAPHKFLYPNNGRVRPAGLRDLPGYRGAIAKLSQVYKFNCGIKDPKRMYLRHYWYEWSKLYEGPLSLEEYVKQIKGVEDLTHHVNRFIERTWSNPNTILYDEETWGPRPYLIRLCLENGATEP